MSSDEQQIAPETLVVLRRLLVQYRARPRIYRDLLLVAILLHSWRSRVDPTGVGASTPGTPSWYLSATEVADLLGVTTDAVQKACRVGRLRAVKRSGSREWAIDPAAVADYRAGVNTERAAG